MERETGFEPATLALARRCSTTELFPPQSQKKRNYTDITREASRRGEGLTGNWQDEHIGRRAIGWRRAGLTQVNREPGSGAMPTAAVLHGDLRHIGSPLLPAQAEVTQPGTVTPGP